MTTVSQQIKNADGAIYRNIESLAGQRSLLSLNILAQLRNLVESIAVLLHTGSPDVEFNYDAVKPSIDFVNSKAKFNFLGKFHKLIQKSASHFTLDGDASERLMLKYCEYLLRLRSLLQDNCGIAVLKNLDAFPVDIDPSLKEYHEKIAARINAVRLSATDNSHKYRYYIHKTRPFFTGGRIYYEVTFYPAADKVSKFDRIIAFTHIDMTDKYAAMLTLRRDSIEVLEQAMPILIISEWEVSIRPCEFKNFSRILGISIEVRSESEEYRYLMNYLTASSDNLLDLVDMTDDMYSKVRGACSVGITKPLIFPVLDEARRLIRSAAPGCNVLRYLMLRMYNQILKSQYDWNGCNLLSGLKLSYGCIPFDNMPFCTSLRGHNPKYWDLVESLDTRGRNHELLARHVQNNVERYGILYTPVSDLVELGDVDDLIIIYNNKLHRTHMKRLLVQDMDHIFISGYENETVSIIEKLQEFASSRVEGYTQAVERWLDENPSSIDDQAKKVALKQLFSESRVALIYGAAGTGKSKMVEHIAHYFNDKEKLFLAHTNPAIDNLKRNVAAQNSNFRTISSHISRKAHSPEFDILVIDECSTVSNTDLIKVLEKTKFKLLVLVGDVYQIESIQFGNWFEIIRSFIPKSSVFELMTPYRTKNESLLGFWNKVRAIKDDIAEVMAHNGYSTMLDKTLFESKGQDEIILCLNYDGLYGINNVNRFLQCSNSGSATTWRDNIYKIGDPVLFNESERFRPVIYNNLKGWIVGIERFPDRIQFDIDIDRPLSELDVVGDQIEYLGESTVRFSVYERESSDEDDDSLNTSVPFQVAYAVSIHKAQGLEYDSVKIVITDANEEDITHSIFYTAITRARKHLRLFWTPETQQAVLQGLHRTTKNKDIYIIVSRRGLKPVKTD